MKEDKNMKKIKILPLLLAAPLLVSCGVSKPKEPKFAEMGKKDQVTGAKFGTDLLAAFSASEFSETAGLLPSSVLKLESKVYYEASVESDGKVVSKDTTGINRKGEAKLDKKNKVVVVEESEKEEGSSKTLNGRRSYSFSDESHVFYQEAKVNKVKYVVEANKEAKTIAGYQKVGEEKVENIVDKKMKNLANDWSNGYYCEGIQALLTYYYGAVGEGDDEEAAKYKFYEKGKVFTIEYTSEVKNEEVKNYEVVVAKKTSKEVTKVQVDLTKGKEKSLAWTSTEESKTIVKDYYEYNWYTGSLTYHYKGNVEKTSSQASEVMSFEHKDVSVKALDVAKFTQIGDKW